MAQTLFKSEALQGFLFQMQNISFHSSGSCRKNIFEIHVVFGFKSDRVFLTSTFWFLSSQFFCFSFLFFAVLFAEHLLDYSWVGKVLGNAFRIFLGLDERNLRLRWVVRYVYMQILRSMLRGVLPFSLTSLTESCSFWCSLKNLFPLLKLEDKVVPNH